MIATAATTGERVFAPRTVRAYAGDWALFTDWCHATGAWELPADPATLVAFLTDCPAAPATLRRRVAAIDHHHTANGHPPPGRSTLVLAMLGRPTGAPTQLTVETAAAVEAALRALPSHGWTQGMFGRRDRCLLVLSQLAGVPYRHLAGMKAADVTVVDSTVAVTKAADAWTVAADTNTMLCGSCAVVRWLRVLDLSVTKTNTGVVADAIDKAYRLTAASPHLCQSGRGFNDATSLAPLFPPIDQWGALPFPLQPLTPHSLSRRVRDLLAGDFGAHRHLPLDAAKDVEAAIPAAVPAVERPVYSREDSQRAWTRRRADLADIAGVEELLNEVDARAKKLERRTAAILVGQTNPNEPDSRNE
jgi:hypothetical protein